MRDATLEIAERQDDYGLKRLLTESGVEAALTREGGSDVLSVHDARGKLLFEWREESRTTVISVPEGDLELRAEQGRVKLMGAEGVEVSGPLFEIRTERLRQIVKRLETKADRIVERARRSYREVEELAQTRAGSLRLVAEDTARLLGKRLRFKAREDAKVKAEKIYLA